MRVLAGDIGGTSSRLAYFDVSDGRLDVVCQRVFANARFSGLAELLEVFMSSCGERAETACFSVAGVVRGGHVFTPNLGWHIDAGVIARRFSVKNVHLMNDLEANAYGIKTLEPSDFEVLNRGLLDAQGNQAVISAGTGLGEAGLYWDGNSHHPFATEGGHADFAPRNRLEVDLLFYLLERFGRVSWERVVSGPGLYNIYQFLRDTGRVEESEEVAVAMREGDPSAVISDFALAGSCALCGQALDIFVALYGAEAGNLALKVMATGGVFIGGGIAPKIREKLKEPLFMEAFAAKGRLRGVMESMPVRVILNEMTALRGAAVYAWRRISASIP